MATALRPETGQIGPVWRGSLVPDPRGGAKSASPSVSGLRRLDPGGVALLRRDESEMRVYNRSYWLQLVSLVRVKKISWRNAKS